jgi:hypothetical protein
VYSLVSVDAMRTADNRARGVKCGMKAWATTANTASTIVKRKNAMVTASEVV